MDIYRETGWEMCTFIYIYIYPMSYILQNFVVSGNN